MDAIKNILVGIDFSHCSAAALRQAVRIAKWNNAQVTALHVVPIPAYALPDGLLGTLELPPVEALQEAARVQWAEWPAADGAGTVTFKSVMGLPRMELLDHVRREHVDLLILGAHGDRDARLGVGSTTSACVQRANTRVLVIRAPQSRPFQTIVACIDFSETSRVALEQAVRIAAQDGAALRVLHVFEDPWQGASPPAGVRSHMPDFEAKYQAAVEDHLRSFCKPFAHEINALKASFHARKALSHGRGIIEFIQQERCDLAVLGTRAKWNVRDFCWGSTAERVVREAPCSVLTVKPSGFDQPR